MNKKCNGQKKEDEYLYLNKFLHLIGKITNKIECGESPDFIITLQNKKIGVELTRFHSSSKGTHNRARREIEKAWDSLQKTIMEEVKKHDDLNYTNGILFFKELNLPSSREYQKFTDELIELSLEMINCGCKKIKPPERHPILNKYLKEFYLEKVNCYINWAWNFDVSSVGITEKELINVSKPKIEKANKYKEKDIDEVWLLIIGESEGKLSQCMGRFSSNTLNNFDELDNLYKQSLFNKVYIYQFIFNVVYEWPGWIEIRN